jgi:K+-transporting ATPase ATPase A chain
MAPNDFLTLATLALAILFVTPLLGRYMYRVMEGERTILSPILQPVERVVYRVCGVDAATEMNWKRYVVALLVADLVAFLAGYAMLRLQDVLPLNPAGIVPMTPDLAFNTSVSFTTNTNWQNYSGEASASYLSQQAMLAVRNFTSAATGIAVAIALVRGLTRRSTRLLGNFWVDLTRSVL